VNFEDVKHHLEPENIGNAPFSIKIGLVSFLFVAIVGAGFYFNTLVQLEVLAKHENTEFELKEEFKVKAAQSAKLELYKEQLAEMEVSFGALLRQLPEKTEVESLLIDVSQTGLASGLEVKTFRPSAEQKKGFYAELPISLEVLGSFHQLATFVSGIAALPRIVTISDLSLVPFKEKGGTTAKLKMSATAKTYRYLQENEQ